MSALSKQALLRLHRGYEVACEVLPARAGFSAYVVVLPVAPDRFRHPEAWLGANTTLPGISPELKNPELITGFEIRYLEHDQKYRDIDWGWDYDYVLADQATRVRRIFVSCEGEIAQALAPWLTDLSLLRDSREFDSSLVASPLNYYLDQKDVYPHLWL